MIKKSNLEISKKNNKSKIHVKLVLLFFNLIPIIIGTVIRVKIVNIWAIENIFMLSPLYGMQCLNKKDGV